MDRPGNAPFKFHQLRSSHKRIKIFELECQECIITNYCLCRRNQLGRDHLAPASRASVSGSQPRASTITFSTSWICSCRSASVILSTYHFSTLMRSLKHEQKRADCKMVSSQLNGNQFDTAMHQEATAFSIRSPARLL